MDRLARRQPQMLCRASSHPRFQTLIAHIDEHVHRVVAIGREAFDGAGENIQSADRLRALAREHHVAGPHVHGDRTARRLIDPWDEQRLTAAIEFRQTVGRLMGAHPDPEQRAGVAGLIGAEQVRPGQEFRGGPAVGHPAVANRHDLSIGQPQQLVQLMTDEHDRQLGFHAEALHVRQHFLLARRVERGQRLVEQQHRGIRQQRPADGDTLLFTAGQAGHTTVEQRPDIEHVDHLIETRCIQLAAREPGAVTQVVAHVHVREQTRLLKHVADTSTVRRHVNGVRAVEHAAPRDFDTTALGPDQPRHDAQQGTLAGARRAEQAGHAFIAVKTTVQ